jgi:3-keto-5-aminohexanoate cleavage enzyme
MSDPVVIEAAINGVTPKSRNPNVPITPDEIAADALACFDAGAAIVHNHVDVLAVPGEEAAERYLEGWRPVLAGRPDALLYPTVNFGTTVEESYSHIRPLAQAGAIRIGLADLASVNLGGRDADGVPTGHYVYANTFDDGHHQLGLCAELGLGPSLAIFEPGFLRTALAWHAAGRLPSGAMVKLYFGGDEGYLGGATFGHRPTERALDAYLELLDGTGLPWSVSVFGGDVVGSGLARLALERGGHLHLGLEAFAGDRTPTNAELVTEAVALCEEVGRPVVSCAEAVDLLGLP